MSQPRRFSIIGPGRAGGSLHSALIDLGWECTRVYGRTDDASQAALGVDVCVIATPDGSITDVAASIEPGDGVLLHLSGATGLSVLGDRPSAGMHPLVSLADPAVGARALRSCYFAVAGHPVAQEMAEALSGKWFDIADTDRALYHCAAAIASNHTVALLGQVERLAASVGVPFEAFEPLVRASIDNAWSNGPSAALTGPAARGDDDTIEAHRYALSAQHPDELESYDALVHLARRLAAD